MSTYIIEDPEQGVNPSLVEDVVEMIDLGIERREIASEAFVGVFATSIEAIAWALRDTLDPYEEARLFERHTMEEVLEQHEDASKIKLVHLSGGRIALFDHARTDQRERVKREMKDMAEGMARDLRRLLDETKGVPGVNFYRLRLRRALAALIQD